MRPPSYGKELRSNSFPLQKKEVKRKHLTNEKNFDIIIP